MQRLSLGLIVFPGALHVARIYLKRLAEAGYELDHVILVTRAEPAGFKSRVAARVWGAARVADHKSRRSYTEAKVPEHRKFGGLRLNGEAIDASFFKPPPLARYCPRLRCVPMNGVEDESLAQALTASGIKHYVYAGFELFRGRPLQLGIRFLHVHSGIVPDIRGINCFLWSLLYRGRPGYSVIYLDENVDTGEVIHTRELGPLEIEWPGEVGDADLTALYQFLSDTYNQQKKAEVLVEAVERLVATGFRLPGVIQAEAGRQYFTGHPLLIRHAMRRLLGARKK